VFTHTIDLLVVLINYLLYTERFYMLNDSTDTTPEFTYQAEEPVPQAQIDLAASEQSLVSSPADAINAKERIAFAAYVKNQGNTIPPNFKDAGAWFDSLKNAQKEYTQSRQEIAALKTKYKEEGATNPEAAPLAMTPTDAPVAAVVVGKEELRIPDAPAITPTPTAMDAVVSQDDWKAWTVEYATKGTLSAETQEVIKTKTKLPDFVINEYMAGQKAKIEVAYAKAAEVIGGKDKLTTLFTWASQNLSKPEQENMNASLASPNWEIALLGLNSKYDKMNPNNKRNEPVVSSTASKIPVASTQVPNQAYRTKREFSNERNNPRFQTDNKYRQAVEQRMMKTDFNKLQA
jgi:hypothetical protein